MVGIKDSRMFELARNEHFNNREGRCNVAFVRAFRRAENAGTDRSGIVVHSVDTIALRCHHSGVAR